MTNEDKKYLSKYMKVDKKVEENITRHKQQHRLNGKVCAWYADWKDFCLDWCKGCGYTKREARGLLFGGTGEFLILPNRMGIIRFAM